MKCADKAVFFCGVCKCSRDHRTISVTSSTVEATVSSSSSRHRQNASRRLLIKSSLLSTMIPPLCGHQFNFISSPITQRTSLRKWLFNVTVIMILLFVSFSAAFDYSSSSERSSMAPHPYQYYSDHYYSLVSVPPRQSYSNRRGGRPTDKLAAPILAAYTVKFSPPSEHYAIQDRREFLQEASYHTLSSITRRFQDIAERDSRFIQPYKELFHTEELGTHLHYRNEIFSRLHQEAKMQLHAIQSKGT